MSTKLSFALIATLLATSGCAQLSVDDGLRFDGQRFRINASKESRDSRQNFEVSVAPASRSLDGARGAALHGGVEYCIENYGTSNIKWVVAPDVEDITPYINGDKLRLTGQCRP